MTNDYLQLQLHHGRIAEQLARGESARHARELPKPHRRGFFDRFVALLIRRQPEPSAPAHATMTA